MTDDMGTPIDAADGSDVIDAGSPAETPTTGDILASLGEPVPEPQAAPAGESTGDILASLGEPVPDTPPAPAGESADDISASLGEPVSESRPPEVGEPTAEDAAPDDAHAADETASTDASATPAEEVEAAADEAPPHVAYGRDPLERWLLGVVALVLVVFVGAAGSLVMYVLSMRSAPRTSAERQLAVSEASVKAQPQDPENWARLAVSYAKVERWSDAQSAIDRGRAVKKAAILDLIEADILRMRGDEGAIKAYDRAIKSAQTEYDKAMQVLKTEKGVTMSAPSPLVAAGEAGKAYALESAGRTEEAVEAAKLSLALVPTDADLHVALGRMYAKLGRSADAEASFREALSYVPGYPPAVKGLKSIGKEQ